MRRHGDIVVWERNGVEIHCAEGFACCGMPAWESGDLDGLRKQARTNLDILEPFVERGAKVIAINPNEPYGYVTKLVVEFFQSH